MSTQSKKNIIDELSTAPIWQKVILAIIITAIFIFTLKNLFLYNKDQELKNLKRASTRQEKEIENYKNTIRNLDAYKNKLEKVSKKQVLLLHKDDYPAILSSLLSFNSKGVKIIKIRPGKQEKQNGIIRKSLFISCEGRIDSLVNMYSQINDMLYSSSIEKLTLIKRSPRKYYSEIFVTTFLTEKESNKIIIKSKK